MPSPPNEPISVLPDAGNVTGSDQTVIARGSDNFRASFDEIATFIGGGVTSINPGTGLHTLGNNTTGNVTIYLGNTAVTPATYGDATHVAQVTVNAQGQIVAAGNVTIAIGVPSFLNLAAAKAGSTSGALGQLQTMGYASPGDGGGATYTWQADIPQVNSTDFLDVSSDPIGFFQNATANGYWVYTPDARGVNMLAFGPDRTGAVDSWQACQDAVDFGVYYAGCKVYAPGKNRFNLSDGLQLGYGDTFVTPMLEGDQYNYEGSATLPGTIFISTANGDRPCINWQGTRAGYIRGIGVLGQLKSYYENNNFCTDQFVIYDTDQSNWNSPALSSTQDSQCAPYAGLCQDAYSGSAPSPAYPNRTLPAWLAGGFNTQYDGITSSGFSLEDWAAYGFICGIINQPNATSPGNGDFLQVGRGSCHACKYMFSTGNPEARTETFGPVTGSVIYSLFTMVAHGARNGQLANTVLGLSFSGAIQIGDFGETPFLGPTVIQSAYVENLWRIGSMISANSGACPVRFLSPKFSFTAQNDVRGYPNYVWLNDSESSTVGVLTIDGGILQDYNNVLTMFGNGIRMVNDVSLVPSVVGEGGNVTSPQVYMLNSTAGGLIVDRFRTKGIAQSIRYSAFNLDASGDKIVVSTSGQMTIDSCYQYGLPIYAKEFGAVSGNNGGAVFNSTDAPISNPQLVYAIDKSSGSLGTITVTGRTINFGYAGDVSPSSGLNCFFKGGTFYDTTSLTVFNVTANDLAGNVVATAQNNYGHALAGITFGSGTSEIGFYAQHAGAGGNSITIALNAASGAGSINVVGTAITITPAAGLALVNNVVAQVNGSLAARELVGAFGAGTGTCPTASATAMTGGSDTDFILGIPFSSTDGGQFVGISMPVFTPDIPFWGTFADGNATISIVESADGSGDITDYVSGGTGECLYNPQRGGPAPTGPVTYLGGVDYPKRITAAGQEFIGNVTANTITLGSGASGTGTIRLGVFIKGAAI